jgi:hypothetical protein
MGLPSPTGRATVWAVRLPFRIPITALAATGVTLGVFGLAASSRVSKFSCRNLPLSETVSPDGARRAVAFVRDCGQRAPRSTQLSVLAASQPVGDHGNLFVADLERSADIEVQWADADVLEVRIGKVRRAYRADPGIGKIRVRYGRMP